MVKLAYSCTIVSLAPNGHKESYFPTLEVQKEKVAEAENERAFRGRGMAGPRRKYPSKAETTKRSQGRDD
jgi:hypothetical protein